MLTDMGVDVKEPTMAADEPYTLSREHLGALPVINFFLAQMMWYTSQISPGRSNLCSPIDCPTPVVNCSPTPVAPR
jgi:hypothetical protein